jgi:hypothetical protein
MASAACQKLASFTSFFLLVLYLVFSMYVAEIVSAAALVWLAVIVTVYLFKRRDSIVMRAERQSDGRKEYVDYSVVP